MIDPAHQPIVPINDLNQNLTGLLGLTKREYFAGLALQGMLSGNLDNMYGSFDSMVESAIDISERLIKKLN